MTWTVQPSPLLSVTMMMVVLLGASGGVEVKDLAYQLKEGESVGFPSHPVYNFTIITRGHNVVFNNWAEYNKFEMGEHIGTHMDAPSHGSQSGWRMHEIPVSRMVGPGVLVDVSGKVKLDSGYRVTVDDIKEWESQHGRIPTGAVVLLRTGWGSRYPDRHQVFNTETLNDYNTYNFPVVSGQVATFLSEERDIIAMGTDTPSPDTGKDLAFPVHKTLLAKNIMILENVANLESVPPRDSLIVMGALKLYDGSGAPMRLFALTDLGLQYQGANGCWTLEAPVCIIFTLVWVLVGGFVKSLF